MGFAGEVGDELEVEADAESRGMRRARGEQAVVVAAAATEAAAMGPIGRSANAMVANTAIPTPMKVMGKIGPPR